MRAGTGLETPGDGLNWHVGDWLNYGERRFAQDAEQLKDVMGWEYDHVAKVKYVAANVQFWLRSQNLSWSHHREIASLPPDEQRHWLDQAVEHGRWIGDWLIYGEGKWGEMYTQAMEITGWEYERLAQIKSVAARVEFCVRTQNLSWTHHQHVSKLSPDLQRLWLQRALDAETTEGKKWSVRRLVKSVANRVQFSSREENLTWAHHVEVKSTAARIGLSYRYEKLSWAQRGKVVPGYNFCPGRSGKVYPGKLLVLVAAEKYTRVYILPWWNGPKPVPKGLRLSACYYVDRTDVRITNPKGTVK